MTDFPKLARLDVSGHQFSEPVKRIHDGPDVQFFLSSLAYRDIVTFILQLNRSVVPRKEGSEGNFQTWKLSDVNEGDLSHAVVAVRKLLHSLGDLIAEAPPDTGPHRFGNISFRKWYNLTEGHVDSLLTEFLPSKSVPAIVELKAYLLGSFGSPQRLDYGTGHELSFLAFLGALWKIKFFDDKSDYSEERMIVLAVFEPYLDLVRKLIKTYNLEPAGSHGVWGLDDNSFLPYVFGSAQLCPAIDKFDDTPTQGSILNAPDPSIVTKYNEVEKEKTQNLYFAAIAFIYDVKKGPFWEHSPVLFDVSGVKDGWGKINKGMIKMYNAEVLSKFPVVQHFPFGSLFTWEKDPEAREAPATIHTTSHPLRNPTVDSNTSTTMRPPKLGTGGTTPMMAPWTGSVARPPPPPIGFANGVTQAPWANRAQAPIARTTAAAQLRRPQIISNSRSIPETKEPDEKT